MKIYWKFDNANTYLYGTTIEQRNTDVYFSNQRMPSSFVIHSWTSRTNYQADRISPQLPLLKKNHTFTTDFFAIGVIGYEFMKGKRPFVGNRAEIKEKMSDEKYFEENIKIKNSDKISCSTFEL